MSAGRRDPILLGPRYQMLEDPAGNLDLAAVIASAGFAPLDLGEDPNLGYSQSAWWFKTVDGGDSTGGQLVDDIDWMDRGLARRVR
ncbi:MULTISPECIES: 7TM-DISM domain-containing protein [unclassified Thiocapsa]|uniref:7TMR-DISMED2 domain-containing protein n=1 Tax=unclassified Thiocapsa TaxID=2641286 RepID=UPI0035B4D09B